MNTACGGNVRELENAIEHALAMKSGLVIKSDNLPVQIVTEIKQPNESYRTTDINSSPLKTETEGYMPASSNKNRLSETQLKPWQLEEKQTIEKALIQHKGNRIKASSELGMSRSTLWRKMTMYRLAL